MAQDGKPSHTPSSKPAVPGLHHNLLSWVGSVVAILAFGNIVSLFLIGFFSKSSSPYLGIFTWVIFPAVLLLGLALFALGMLIERRRRGKSGIAVAPYPTFDFNSPQLRRSFLWSALAAMAFVILSGVGSYKAYETSESVSFCGTTCHVPMHPEFTAYQISPHARIRCVDCHVGSGAGWYVRSKLNGAHQLYAVAFNHYKRPIATPIPNLRPAQDTCEQCHWPERFIGAQLKVFNHYSSDEKNTPRQIRMLMKTGGGSVEGPMGTGIHWHMNIANKVTYIASDPQRQVIPWVRLEDREGRVTEYKLKRSDITPQQIAAAPKRVMDCIDCHSRPSHVYVPPDESVDLALLNGAIDRTLPGVKALAVEALTKPYNSTPEAVQAIARDLDAGYRTKYPKDYESRKPAIKQAIAETQRIFQQTIFPEMKVDWRTHPNNIGHFYSPGCFRCHDGEHVSADGKVVSKDCETCHTVLAQEEGSNSNPLVARGTGFKHPIELGDLTDVTCTDCHNGGVGP
jgi:NapC/NirT cytochrome c family, N-terminal region/Cytochrome c3